MKMWWSRWVLNMTVESVWNSGEHSAVVAWLMDHVGRDGNNTLQVLVIPCLGPAVFKILVIANGGYVIHNGDLLTRWEVGGIRILPKEKWCE